MIRSGQTSRDALARSCDLLNQANLPVLGIVVNGVSSSSAGSYYYGYYPQLAKGYYGELASRLNETHKKILGSLLSTMLDGW